MSVGKRFRFEGTHAFVVEKSELHPVAGLLGFQTASSEKIKPTRKRMSPKEFEIGLPDLGRLQLTFAEAPTDRGQALLRKSRKATLLLMFPDGGGIVQIRGKCASSPIETGTGELFQFMVELLAAEHTRLL